jgi:hypothetical protein
MRRIYEIVRAGFGYLHEIFHYLPALVFGMNPSLKRNEVVFDWDENRKFANVFVISGPILVGALGLAITVLFWVIRANTSVDHWNYGSFVLLFGAWLLSCSADIEDLIDVIKFGHKTKRMEE